MSDIQLIMVPRQATPEEKATMARLPNDSPRYTGEIKVGTVFRLFDVQNNRFGLAQFVLGEPDEHGFTQTCIQRGPYAKYCSRVKLVDGVYQTWEPCDQHDSKSELVSMDDQFKTVFLEIDNQPA